MKPSTFLSLYDKLEKLVRHLPESLQGPILREITPIKARAKSAVESAKRAGPFSDTPAAAPAR